MQPQFSRQQPANMESAVLPHYYAEVNDYLLTPWAVYRLCEVLQDSQEEFDLFLSTESSSDSLNVPPTVWNQGLHRQHCRPHQTDAWRQLDKAITSQEQLQWTVHREDIQGRVAKHVKFSNSSFSVRLT
eukprot:jgi/Chrzof1/158/Cz01g05150.t1